MDILTERGQQSLADEQQAQNIFTSNYPRYQYAQTPKEKPADVDAFLIRDGIIGGVVETKCRYDVDLEEFKQRYSCEWLVTFDKILKGKQVADALCTKLVGFLYIVQSKTLLVQTIADNGLYVPSIKIMTTQTQATINGRTAVRSNAFIDMSSAKSLVLKT
jgi:hypothetical protein